MGRPCPACGAETEHGPHRGHQTVRTEPKDRREEIVTPKTARRPRVRVKLDGCHHTPLFYSMSHPLVGDALLCYRCNKSRDVVEIEILSVRVVCWTCRFKRTFGVTLTEGVTFGKRHSETKGHEVSVFDLYGQCVRRYDPKVVQLSLPEMVDNSGEV